MAVGKKKYKIFKICKELNLGHETIFTFLEGKGLKIKGLNASVNEDIYIDILEKFATDKEKAEKLKARKKSEAAPVSEKEDTTKEANAEDSTASSYMKALKKSIADGVEAFQQVAEEKPEEKPKKKKKATAVKEVDEAVKTVEPPAQIDKTIKTRPTAEKSVDVKNEEIKKTKATEQEVEHESSPVKTEKKSKPKLPAKKQDEISHSAEKKSEPKKTKRQDENLSEKEKKHRKAMAMIRKEKDFKKNITHQMEPGVDGEAREAGRRKKRKKKKSKNQVDLQEVQNTLKKTLASIDTKSRKPKKVKKVKTETGEIVEENIIQVTEFISANDLANLMDVNVSEIITKCLELGLVVSINQRLDLDTINLLAEEYGYKVEEQYAKDFVDDEEALEEEEDEANLVPRAPIVTIMGHVDHGKTSLLDRIRKSNVVDGEAGGITQHIGAYSIEYEGKSVTFLDTPGHEAFTAMRARGAQVTDIVVLIVAADDAVMPQTDEALDHAKAAGVKIIIAINKIDKPGANAERIKQQLAERDVLVEDWGGSYQNVEISAMTGKGIPELLEKILLESEMLELKANPDAKAQGVVVESRLDKGKGAIATVLIQKGRLKVGDTFVAGLNSGKVRALLDDQDKRIDSIDPSQPGVVIGFEGVSQAGDKFMVMKDERTARDITLKRQQLKREQDDKQVKLVTLAQISEQIKSGEVRDLPIIVKADVDGSAEALADSLINLNTSEVQVNVVRKGVGPVSESDVLLASASGAVIVAFHVRANANARTLAEKENVDIRVYRVIYDAINDVRMALEGLLAPTLEETVVGQAEVRDIFKVSRVGTIAGCHVKTGKMLRKNKIRIVRNDIEIYSGNIASLKRFKEDVKEVTAGFECGIQIENYNDLKIGDVIESYEIAHIKRKLN
jgi:translation initiation factor IF-2